MDTSKPIPMNDRERRAHRNATTNILTRTRDTLGSEQFLSMILAFAEENEAWLRREYPDGELVRMLDERRTSGLK